MTVAFSPDGKFIASGGLDNVLLIYNLEECKDISKIQPKKSYSDHSGYISSCKYLTSDKIVTSSGDKSCRVWDITNDKSTEFIDHDSDVMCLDVNPKDSNQFLSGSCDKCINLWDIKR
jgi:guanine nucleotide-binding protein G(I)/G(S)/G(T) subunit beta-1